MQWCPAFVVLPVDVGTFLYEKLHHVQIVIDARLKPGNGRWERNGRNYISYACLLVYIVDDLFCLLSTHCKEKHTCVN